VPAGFIEKVILAVVLDAAYAVILIIIKILRIYPIHIPSTNKVSIILSESKNKRMQTISNNKNALFLIAELSMKVNSKA